MRQRLSASASPRPPSSPPSTTPLLPRSSFWFDEVFTANLTTFQVSPLGVVQRVAAGDAHPPLYYLYALGCSRALGLWGKALEGPPEGVERGLRACNLPVLAATGAVLGLALPPGRALLAGLLLLATPSYGQKAVEARMYPLLALFLLLALHAFLRGRTLWFSLASLGAFYTHYLSLLFLAPLVVLEGARVWRERREEGVLSLLLLGLFVPWLPVFLAQAATGANAWLRPAPYLALYAYQDYGGHLLVFLLLLALLLSGVWYLRERAPWAALGLLAVALFPLLWTLQGLWLNTVSERYFGAFAPAFLYAALVAAPSWGRLLWPGLWAAGGLGLLALTLAPPGFPRRTTPPGPVPGPGGGKGPPGAPGEREGQAGVPAVLPPLGHALQAGGGGGPPGPPREGGPPGLPPSLATERGALLLELERRLEEEGYRRRVVPGEASTWSTGGALDLLGLPPPLPRGARLGLRPGGGVRPLAPAPAPPPLLGGSPSPSSTGGGGGGRGGSPSPPASPWRPTPSSSPTSSTGGWRPSGGAPWGRPAWPSSGGRAWASPWPPSWASSWG